MNRARTVSFQRGAAGKAVNKARTVGKAVNRARPVSFQRGGEGSEQGRDSLVQTLNASSSAGAAAAFRTQSPSKVCPLSGCTGASRLPTRPFHCTRSYAQRARAVSKVYAPPSLPQRCYGVQQTGPSGGLRDRGLSRRPPQRRGGRSPQRQSASSATVVLSGSLAFQRRRRAGGGRGRAAGSQARRVGSGGR